MPGGPTIYDDIIEVIDENGKLDVSQYRRLVLLALVDLGRGRHDIEDIKKKVERLERNSILLIAKQHPKATTTITTLLVALVILTIYHLGLTSWVAGLFNIPLVP